MKKIIMLSLFTFHFSLFTLKAQGSWSPRTPTPALDSLRFQGVSFSIGNYGYSGLGSGYAGSYDDIWQFDPSNDSWSQKANFPGSAKVSPATFVIGNKAYLVTGSVRSGGACVTECWQYDGTIDTWIQKANFPGLARTYATGFAIGGKGYVGAGGNEDIEFYKDFYAYDTATDTWARIADFPGIARNAACGFAVGSNGYVCFGQDSILPNFKNTDMWEYDTGSNTWTQKTSYPGPPTYVASGFVIGNYIYVGGGQDTAVCDSRFWQYNTMLDFWAEQVTMPKPTGFQGTVFSIADTGYYGMGVDSASEIPHNFSRFIPDATMGINELNTMENEISIFPNPVKNICTILLPEMDNQIMPEFTLSDMEGKEMEISIIKYSSYNYLLHRGSLKVGEYLLTLKINNKYYSKKITVIN